VKALAANIFVGIAYGLFACVCVIAGSILQTSYIKQRKELEGVEQIENLLKMAEKLTKKRLREENDHE
jgi:hypothetical protein